MASQEGVIVFLPFLLSVMLLHHHFPTSVISAQSDNLTLPLLSSPDTQTDNVLLNSDINIQMIQSDFHTSPSPPPSEIQMNVSSNSNLKVQKTQSPAPPAKPPTQTGRIGPSNSNLKQQRTESEFDISPSLPPSEIQKNVPSNSNIKVQKTQSPPPPSKPPTQTTGKIASSNSNINVQRINSDPHSPPSSSPTQTQKNVPSSSDIEAQKSEESFSTHLEMVTGHDDEIIHTEL